MPLSSWGTPDWGGEMVNSRSDAPGWSLAEHELVVRVESVAVRQAAPDPHTEPLLFPVTYLSCVCLTFSNRKSWLSEVYISHSSWEHFVSLIIKAISNRPSTQACSAREKGHRRKTTWGSLVEGNRSTVFHTLPLWASSEHSQACMCTPWASLALSISHKPHRPSRRQRATVLLRDWCRCLRTRCPDISRSGRSDQSYGTGKTVFPEYATVILCFPV